MEKKGRKKRDERENVWCAHYMCTEEEHATVFFVLFFREKNRLPAALPTTCHFVFVFQATRPAAAPKTKAASVSPTTVTISSFNYSLSSFYLLLFRQFQRKTERKKKRKNEKTEIKTKAKPKMTSKMDDF